jgi:hypothetical protein
MSVITARGKRRGRAAVRRLFLRRRGNGRTGNDGLTCPETGERFATRDTDPIDWNPIVEYGTGVATYECPHCGGRHAVLWGTRTPVLLGDG